MKKPEAIDTLLETATVGGGCFWCLEAILDEVNGVEGVTSGYAGGQKEEPTYREVCNGTTGHAEVVQLSFNPTQISYADLLRIFFAMHNPTVFNRQRAGAGSQYRSVILSHNKAQEQTARELITELEPYFDKKIVTEVAPFTKFYKAEERHQHYYKRDPSKAYCRSVINPKLHKLREHFKHIIKPALPQP